MNMEEKEATFSGENLNTDENISDSVHVQEMTEREEELDKLRSELQDQKDRYLRLFAEFDNFKRRNARERMELIQTAGKEIIVSLLDVLDDCDRAEKELQKSTDSDQIEGVQLVFNKLRSVLQSRGLRAMETIHTEFDVEKHEAITEIPAPEPALKGKVLDELTKGYYLNDKIIRFAKVIVGK
jgi:molecular chaperone GrpE